MEHIAGRKTSEIETTNNGMDLLFPHSQDENSACTNRRETAEAYACRYLETMEEIEEKIHLTAKVGGYT